MTIKTGSRGAVNGARVTKGTVLEVDANNVALVRMTGGQRELVRADMLRGKSAAPKPGETWIFDQPYGAGWMFAVPMNYLGGDQDFTVPVLAHNWVAAAGYQPVGYIKDSEGWVACRGRLTGGTANQSAFTLPEGYRPVATASFVVCVGTGSGVVTVSAAGAVTPVGAGDASLEQVRFMAVG